MKHDTQLPMGIEKAESTNGEALWERLDETIDLSRKRKARFAIYQVFLDVETTENRRNGEGNLGLRA